jgi:hypothetical protein
MSEEMSTDTPHLWSAPEVLRIPEHGRIDGLQETLRAPRDGVSPRPRPRSRLRVDHRLQLASSPFQLSGPLRCRSLRVRHQERLSCAFWKAPHDTTVIRLLPWDAADPRSQHYRRGQYAEPCHVLPRPFFVCCLTCSPINPAAELPDLATHSIHRRAAVPPSSEQLDHEHR